MSSLEDHQHVADIDEFRENNRVLVDIKGREIGIFKTHKGFYAVGNYCVHQGGPLCEGKVSGAVTADEDFELEYTKEDEVISCPWHAWEFDIETGEHLAQTGHKVPTYDVEVEDGKVYLRT